MKLAHAVRGAAVAAALAGATLAAGCARTTDAGELSRFSEAAGKVREQADAAFDRANALSRQRDVDAFVASRRLGLSDAAFPPLVPQVTVSAWDAALTDLERYGALLADLAGGGRGAATSSAIAGLGRQLADSPAHAAIDPRVGAGFAALAGALVDASAQRSARAVMSETDPSVRRLLSAMAEAVGTDGATGLQGTVRSNWTASLGSVRDAYAAAAERGDEPRQRALVAEYLAATARRDADLRALASLRASLLALADAHTAAAVGSARTQEAVLQSIDRRLEALRRDVRTLEGGRP